MKMKKTAMLLTALALGVFAAHAGAETIYSDRYETVNEAVNALNDGDTLVITKDSTFNNEEALDDLNFTKEAILDLNGHTLTWKGDFTTFCVGNKLTIIDSAQNGGKIESIGNKYAIDASCTCNIDIREGTIIGKVRVVGSKQVGFSKVTISGGEITGGFECLNYYGENDEDRELFVMEVTGGTFTDDSYAAYMKDGYTKIETENGYVIDKQITATVATENVAQETVADTMATGFVTTISSNEAFDLKTIKWDVAYNGETRSTSEYKLDGITVNGDAKIGLAVGGFADATATATATVNGYLK